MIRNLSFTVAVTIAFAPVLVAHAAPASAPAEMTTPAQAVGGHKGVESGDLNRTVDACTHFYEFANGTWRAENPIPDSMPQWSRRVAAREANRQRVQSILEEVSRKKDWAPASTEQLVGDYYASCMDEAGVDAAGLTPLAPLLAEIDGIRNPADAERIIRRLHELAIPVPFGTTGARVVDPLSDSPEFQQAFACKGGAEMVRRTEKRCAVW